MPAPATQDESERAAQWIAEFSHEIRTPLTAILGYVEMLLDAPPGTVSPARQAEALGIIQSSGRHLLDLSNTALAWSRARADIAAKLEVFSPRALCEEVLAWMSSRVPSSAVALRMEIDHSLPDYIASDPTCLRQILVNLIGNSLKFTTAGEVVAKLSARTTAEDAWRLHVAVRDTGIGMTNQEIARLFRPFAQSNQHIQQQFGGSGLGLVISRRLAQSLGGELNLVSTPGVGSTFTLEIPVRIEQTGPRNASTAQEQRQTPCWRLEGKRILLADDCLETRRLATLILQHEGALVTEVKSGREAYACAIAGCRHSKPPRSFDVVLMDLHMPDWDGLVTTRRLRLDGYSRPILALSAAVSNADRKAILAAGCNDFAAKPIDRTAFVELVRRWAANEPACDSQLESADMVIT